MEEYEFEEFKSLGSRFNLVISLGKAERFYFNSAFSTKYHLLAKVGVKLLYDKKRNAVGFRFLDNQEEGMVPIKKLTDHATYINAKGFLGIYDISAKKFSGRYHAIEKTDSTGKNIFVIELQEKAKKS